jgi:hypothetical protein
MALEFLRQGKQVVLLYSSRSKADAAFLDELQGLAAASPGRFKFVFSVTGKDSSWAGRNGRVDRALIEEQVRHASALHIGTLENELCYCEHDRSAHAAWLCCKLQNGHANNGQRVASLLCIPTCFALLFSVCLLLTGT